MIKLICGLFRTTKCPPSGGQPIDTSGRFTLTFEPGSAEAKYYEGWFHQGWKETYCHNGVNYLGCFPCSLTGSSVEIHYDKADDPKRWKTLPGLIVDKANSMDAEVKRRAKESIEEVERRNKEERKAESSDPEWAQVNGHKRFVVCAAYKHLETGQIALGVRHSCPILRAQMQAMGGEKHWKNKSISGFVDNFSRFMTREEAMELALLRGQRRFRCGGDQKRFYSENLY